MAIEVRSSSPPLLPVDVNSEPILSYSRHYAKKIHDLGKSSRETWIQTLVDHVLHGPHPTRPQPGGSSLRKGRGGGGGARGDRDSTERLYESFEGSPNMLQHRKNSPAGAFDLAGATSRRNGRIMNSLNDSPYLPKTKIQQNAPLYLRKIVQTREGYREVSHRGSRDNLLASTTTNAIDKDDDKISTTSSSYKSHNYPPIKNIMSKEHKVKILIPQELASSPYVSNRQHVQIVPIRTKHRPQTQNTGVRKWDNINGGSLGAGGGASSNQRTKHPYLQSAPAHSHSSYLTEAWRPLTMPTTAQVQALEKRAKTIASKAVKENKIFTCEGPYPLDAYVRFSLRKRGWVEKFAPKIHNFIPAGKGTSSKLECELDEDFDIICNRQLPAPWEEDHGFYAIMSRLVRHRPARFIWAGRAVNAMILHHEVIVNHFPKARHFASKTGIASSLRDLPWLASSDPMDFFPRCYLLSEDEREDFVEDFRMCACISLLKCVMSMFTMPEDTSCKKNLLAECSKTIEVIHEDEETECTTPQMATHHITEQSEDSRPGHEHDTDQSVEQTTEHPPPNDPNPEEGVPLDDLENNNLELGEDVTEADYTDDHDPDFASSSTSDDDDDDDDSDDLVDKVSLPIAEKGNKSKRVGITLSQRFNHNRPVKAVITKPEKMGGEVPSRAVDWALNQCERYIRFKTHDDLDQRNKPNLSTGQWEQFLKWYYKVAHDGATVTVTESKLQKVKAVLAKVHTLWKQYDIDGMRNLWIIKPGGKSKGIGIEFCTNLDDMLKYIENTTLTGTYVVQKYIETPCLIYKTKFDIRQWFVVTDWNPLTVWFYKGSYLRICSQEYTLDSLHEAIHLSNVAIQQFYLNGERQGNLPDDNYMNSDEFEEYLASIGAGTVWADIVYPGMISGVVNTLLATSDVAENKKAAFELYGADFMLSDNYLPWLLEINSSPGMAPTTKAKAKMCANVIDDLMKVILDRRENKSCDTGNFELVFKDQPLPMFKSVDNRMYIEGNRIKRTDLQRYTSLDNVVKSGDDPAKNEFLKQLRNKQKEEPQQLKEASSGRSAAKYESTRDREELRRRGSQNQDVSHGQSRGKDLTLIRSFTKIYGDGKAPKQGNYKSQTNRNLTRRPASQSAINRLGKDAKKSDNKAKLSLTRSTRPDTPEGEDTEGEDVINDDVDDCVEEQEEEVQEEQDEGTEDTKVVAEQEEEQEDVGTEDENENDDEQKVQQEDEREEESRSEQGINGVEKDEEICVRKVDSSETQN